MSYALIGNLLRESHASANSAVPLSFRSVPLQKNPLYRSFSLCTAKQIFSVSVNICATLSHAEDFAGRSANDLKCAVLELLRVAIRNLVSR
jgi:hypothetical protein